MRHVAVDSDQFANRATAALRGRERAIADRPGGHRQDRPQEQGRPHRRAAAHRGRGLPASSAARRSSGSSAAPCATCTAPCSTTTRTPSCSPSRTWAPWSRPRSRRCSPSSPMRSRPAAGSRSSGATSGSTGGDLARAAQTRARGRAPAARRRLSCWRWRGRALPRHAPGVRRAGRGGGRRAASSSSSPTGSCARPRSTTSTAPTQRAAAGAVWDAFLADLRTAAWIMAGCGAVVAAAADSLLRPVDVRVPLRRAGAWLTREPERTWVRAAARRRARRRRRRGDRRARRRRVARGHGARRLPDLHGRHGDPAAGLPPSGARGGRGGDAWLLASPAAGSGARRGADRGRGRRLPRLGRARAPRRPAAAAATVTPRCATSASTRSCCRPPTTRCRRRCRAGTPPSRTARSRASSRTGSAGC